MPKSIIEDVNLEDKIVTQTISMRESVKKEIAKKAKENGRSLSAEIAFRATQSLKAEGVML